MSQNPQPYAEPPEWVKQGARVLVIRPGRFSTMPDSFDSTKVERITKTMVRCTNGDTFTIDRDSGKLRWRGPKHSWTPDPEVVALDSDKARALIEAHRLYKILREAQAAVERFDKTPSSETAAGAIAALEQYRISVPHD